MNETTSRLFTSEDRTRILEAVRSAESRTSGEIVPYVVERSDHYEEAEWRGGFLCGIVAFAVAALEGGLARAWDPVDLLEVCLLSVVSAVIGMLVVHWVPFVTRLLAGKHRMDFRVRQRAAEAFIAEEVFNTRNRTGILLFISLMERRVLVVGDTGINAKVGKDDWHDVVQLVVQGITSGSPAAGLITAIGKCGDLLAQHGVARREDDRDELPDDLRIGKDE
jgi:putative membrane protein